MKRENRDRVQLGAIRWDGWFEGNPWQANLNPQKWHTRLPFFGRETGPEQVEVVEDSQDAIDQELVYAHAGELDYWAFLHYHADDWRTKAYNYGLKRYLESPKKSLLNFCVLIYPVAGDDWEKQVWDVVELVKEPTYQKVCGGRPLIYLLFWDTAGRPENTWKEPGECEAAIASLRVGISEAGFPNPYLAVLAMSAGESAGYVDRLGLDALGSYANWTSGAYQDLAAVNWRFWEECKATGQKMIPLVSAGWDPRPRYESKHASLYGNRDWADAPTPEELASHISSACKWVETNQDAAEQRTALIYAWNEVDEGGYLLPTLSEGDARLKAIQKRRCGDEVI